MSDGLQAKLSSAKIKIKLLHSGYTKLKRSNAAQSVVLFSAESRLGNNICKFA